jgi:hypothetical protein
MNERGSSGVTDLGSSQHETSTNPALQPRSRLGVGGVVPGTLPVGEVGRKRFLPRDLIGKLPERVDIPATAALGDELPAGPERAIQRREQRIVVVYPVERGVREDRVDRLGQVQLDQVLAQNHRPIAQRG